MPPQRLRPLRTGTVLHRIHRLIHDPIYFGPPGSTPEQRYDDPDGNYKLLYAALRLDTAFGETLVRVPTVTDILSTDVLVRARSELITTGLLRLYPLVDGGVSAHGLSFTDLHGANYRRTWEISAWVHANTAADGILYTSRLNNQRCIALFDRVSAAITTTSVIRVALTPELATQLAERFGKNYIDP